MARQILPRKHSQTALELIAARFKVLSEPTRLRLLCALQPGEMNVTQLVAATDATQANVSRHLQTLADAGLVARRKSGLNVFYHVSDPSIFQLCDLVLGSVEKRLTQQTKAFANGARFTSLA